MRNRSQSSKTRTVALLATSFLFVALAASACANEAATSSISARNSETGPLVITEEASGEVFEVEAGREVVFELLSKSFSAGYSWVLSSVEATEGELGEPTYQTAGRVVAGGQELTVNRFSFTPDAAAVGDHELTFTYVNPFDIVSFGLTAPMEPQRLTFTLEVVPAEPIRLGEADDGAEIAAAIGDSLEVTLPSSAWQVGYRWVVVKGGDALGAQVEEVIETPTAYLEQLSWQLGNAALGSHEIELHYGTPQVTGYDPETGPIFGVLGSPTATFSFTLAVTGEPAVVEPEPDPLPGEGMAPVEVTADDAGSTITVVAGQSIAAALASPSYGAGYHWYVEQESPFSYIDRDDTSPDPTAATIERLTIGTDAEDVGTHDLILIYDFFVDAEFDEAVDTFTITVEVVDERPPVRIGEDDNGATVEVLPGQALEVRLPSDFGSYGRSWRIRNPGGLGSATVDSVTELVLGEEVYFDRFTWQTDGDVVGSHDIELMLLSDWDSMLMDPPADAPRFTATIVVGGPQDAD